MEKKIINVNGNVYEFINETWETRNAWGHRSVLLKNGNEIGNNKVRYYNRTWESYRYQTCMLGVIRGLLEERYNELLNDYKLNNDICRLTEKRRQDFEDTMLQYDELYNEYKQVKEEL